VIGFNSKPDMNGNNHNPSRLSNYSKTLLSLKKGISELPILFLLRLFFPGGITLITLALLLFTLAFVLELSGNHHESSEI